MTTPDDFYVKSAIEAVLFISEKPVTLQQLKDVLDLAGTAQIRSVVEALMKEYEENHRGMIITEIAGGYQMLSSPHLAPYVRNFFKKNVKERLSRPGLECLAIIAYKQPVTRGEIELIRGVNSDGVVALLSDKQLIKIVGRKDVPGRPYLYGTTKLFLEYFGLKSLEDMPRLEEFAAMVQQTEASATDLHPPPAMEQQAQDAAPTDGDVTPEAVPASAEEQSDSSQQAENEDQSAQENVAGPAREDTPAGDDQKSAPPKDDSQTAVEDAGDLKEAMDQFNRNEAAASRPEDAPSSADLP